MDDRAFEVKLRDERTRLGLTQAQLAKETGLSQAAVSALEQGKIEPTLRTALAIAAVLGVALTALWILSADQKGGGK